MQTKVYIYTYILYIQFRLYYIIQISVNPKLELYMRLLIYAKRKTGINR